MKPKKMEPVTQSLGKTPGTVLVMLKFTTLGALH